MFSNYDATQQFIQTIINIFDTFRWFNIKSCKSPDNIYILIISPLTRLSKN